MMVWTGGVRDIGEETFNFRLSRHFWPDGSGVWGHPIAKNGVEIFYKSWILSFHNWWIYGKLTSHFHPSPKRLNRKQIQNFLFYRNKQTVFWNSFQRFFPNDQFLEWFQAWHTAAQSCSQGIRHNFKGILKGYFLAPTRSPRIHFVCVSVCLSVCLSVWHKVV